ncbi:MAG: 2-oxo acid dehydrogenase subunit E2 [Actinomycetota bacterium]|nr:2-oxo acid dehydrogenase subunit E2 [Actinomycetota bacterium]
MPDFKLPDLGEGVAEAEIDRWHVEEGDVVDEDQALVDVITDKASAEIPSPYGGVVSKIHYGTGDIAPVGAVLVSIDAAPDHAAAAALPSRPAAAPGPGGDPAPEIGHVGDIKATPSVRRLARDLSVKLHGLEGSGPGGRILPADVQAQVGTPSPATRSHEHREPLRGVRRAVATRMSEAHRMVPPVTHVEECEVTELEAIRKRFNERSFGGPKLTFLPFIVHAVVAALEQYPALNASLDEVASEIVFHDRYDIGIAVDTPDGLVVPVVRSADLKSVPELATDIERLASAARAGELQLDELQGSTFTVTSPGAFGGLMATPIVFYPQAAILGVHKATERPVVRDDQVVVRRMMNLSITFDHRVLDGMTAAKFILKVIELIEHPAMPPP